MNVFYLMLAFTSIYFFIKINRGICIRRTHHNAFFKLPPVGIIFFIVTTQWFAQVSIVFWKPPGLTMVPGAKVICEVCIVAQQLKVNPSLIIFRSFSPVSSVSAA